ncbi:PREDICTED: uncharacterized protein LOC108690257 [Atta colombica]|uniref:uncharacterized protein LOC108690257 n=1 Tax=Atta colombica TaxID=520822 RepID=UPI00084C702F|nr:PREDICTED: uncharacterized protein LOC108690257 [Atta colombica]
MPCDGKNPNCDRRRDLLAQLKCLISSMDRKKPCEWDESCRPIVYCPTKLSLCTPPYCLTDLGDVDTALRKFYYADQARETALAAYCRLACDEACQREIMCDNKNETLCASGMSNCVSNPYQFCVPSPYIIPSCDIYCTPYN